MCKRTRLTQGGPHDNKEGRAKKRVFFYNNKKKTFWRVPYKIGDGKIRVYGGKMRIYGPHAPNLLI